MKRRFVLRFKRGKQFLDLNRKVWKIVENEKIPWNGTNECVETTLWHLYHFSQIGGSKVFFQSDEQYEKVELFRFYKNMQMFRGFSKNFPTKGPYPQRAFFLITESSSRNSRDKRTVHLVENKIRVKKKKRKKGKVASSSSRA